jgi:hypothetical protein
MAGSDVPPWPEWSNGKKWRAAMTEIGQMSGSEGQAGNTKKKNVHPGSGLVVDCWVAMRRPLRIVAATSKGEK